MNPFLNPLFSARIIKHYLTDVNRAWKKKPEEIKRYQDKCLKRMLKYAYQVPLYRRKYKEAGIHPDDIHGIEDLHKLPLVTKEDLIKGFPDEIIPPNYNKNNAYLVGTSGSSGRPMSMYKDMEYITIEALAGVRQLKAYGMNWRKTRITNIGDFSVPTTTDEECLKKGLLRNLSLFFSLNNYQNLYTGEEARILLKKMEAFEPELLIGYTSVLMGLASLKMKGVGKKVKPEYVISSGEVLDGYSRKYIEEAFGTHVLNLYATTEGGSIAFECLRRNLHINSDFIHVEILDKNGEPVGENEFGSVVITRLYRGGTPIVRYTGLNDIASLENEYCDCGMYTPLLKTLEGRKKDAIILPDGRIFPPATIPMPLAETASKFSTYQIKRFQFVQKDVDDIEIRIEIDDEQRDKGVKVDKLLEEIKKNYQKLVGDKVRLEVKEVEKVESIEGSTSPPLIISKLDKKRIEEVLL
ncbi:MAG: phenylacetate--CoA ligase family protein [Thermoplasmata archaeon]|nr:MAG: phenylacetate--CoA ligase family protein [Thermoplasmata archaeon]